MPLEELLTDYQSARQTLTVVVLLIIALSLIAIAAILPPRTWSAEKILPVRGPAAFLGTLVVVGATMLTGHHYLQSVELETSEKIAAAASENYGVEIPAEAVHQAMNDPHQEEEFANVVVAYSDTFTSEVDGEPEDVQVKIAHHADSSNLQIVLPND